MHVDGSVRRAQIILSHVAVGERLHEARSPSMSLGRSQRVHIRDQGIWHDSRTSARCSIHRQAVPRPSRVRAAGEQLGGQADGHFQGVGPVVVVADGKLLELLDQQPRAGAVAV